MAGVGPTLDTAGAEVAGLLGRAVVDIVGAAVAVSVEARQKHNFISSLNVM